MLGVHTMSNKTPTVTRVNVHYIMSDQSTWYLSMCKLSLVQWAQALTNLVPYIRGRVDNQE
jgi:hypothetical protein